MLNYENIKLENGKYLNRFYGKYNANVTFVSLFEFNNKTLSEFEKRVKEEIAIEPLKYFSCDCYTYYLRGFFRINAKGTKVFELAENGNCIFLGVKWGGAFSKSNGEMTVPYPKERIRYYHDAPSNGGGLGNTYYVFDLENWNNLDVQVYNEDDF